MMVLDYVRCHSWVAVWVSLCLLIVLVYQGFV